MTPTQIRLVRTSFAYLEPNVVQLGRKFYDRLFTYSPELRPLFQEDMAFQHEKFMKVVAELVSLHLRSLLSLPATSGEPALPALVDLGRRHIQFGVRPEYFPLMRKALLAVIAEELGDAFTPEISEAWIAAYDMMAKTMIKGLQNKPPQNDFLSRIDAAPTPDEQGLDGFMR